MLICPNFLRIRAMFAAQSNPKLNQCIATSMPGELIVSTTLPLCPEIKLYLVLSQTADSTFIQNNIAQLMENPPYWALCWAGGQVLARYILNYPDTVKDKTIVDFGAGSGVVAIAAAKAGAKKVYACDCDMDSIEAIKENANLNGVEVEAIESLDEIEIGEGVDLIAAADLLYDNKNLPLMEQFLKTAKRVLIADSRFSQFDTRFDYPNQKLLFKQPAATCPDLDNTGEYSNVSVYQFET